MIFRFLRFCILFLWAGAGLAQTTYTRVDFADLAGWQEDDHQKALDVFRNTCPDMKGPEWAKLCAIADFVGNARTFFEMFFAPVMVRDGEPMMFTGYYEPEVYGSRTRNGRFQHPIYAVPPELTKGSPWKTRREIVSENALADRGLEIAYLDDPVDLFFLQIQGSGRIKLAEGGSMRVGYGGTNGHKYRSIGREMIRRGLLEVHEASAASIKAWVRKNPVDGLELLNHNPTYIFFRKIDELKADEGPRGAMNRSIIKLRSIAVDPQFTPLGAPVWIEKDGKNPLNRLMVAQDTGSAIKGAQRADIFFGSGAEAGRRAGKLKDSGRMIVLFPIQVAQELVGELDQ